MNNKEKYNKYVQDLFILNKQINKLLFPKENWVNEELMLEAEKLQKEKQQIELYKEEELIIPRIIKKHTKFNRWQGLSLYSDNWHDFEKIRGLNDEILTIMI